MNHFKRKKFERMSVRAAEFQSELKSYQPILRRADRRTKLYRDMKERAALLRSFLRSMRAEMDREGWPE